MKEIIAPLGSYMEIPIKSLNVYQIFESPGTKVSAGEMQARRAGKSRSASADFVRDTMEGINMPSVEIKITGSSTVKAGKLMAITANVDYTPSIVKDTNTLTKQNTLTYVMCFGGIENCQNKTTVCVARSASHGKIAFKFTAPETPGQYMASLVVLQNSGHGPIALDKVSFPFVVEEPHWWDVAFASIASKENLKAASTEIASKLGILSSLFSKNTLSKTYQDAYRTEVLGTLFVKLRHGSSNEKLIAAAALAEFAATEEARVLIMNSSAINSLAHLSFWGEHQTRIAAKDALEKLAYGNETYYAMICAALSEQCRVFSLVMRYSQSMKSKVNISSKQAGAINEVAKQTGTSYRSNNAGDGPEKTRDRKYWFPRFKSNWLGTYRSKKMFTCCECALNSDSARRYKPADGKHCKCGRDQWKKARTMEEGEYNSRVAMSKRFGGIKYEDAVTKARTMGTKRVASDMGGDIKRMRGYEGLSINVGPEMMNVFSNNDMMTPYLMHQQYPVSPAESRYSEPASPVSCGQPASPVYQQQSMNIMPTLTLEDSTLNLVVRSPVDSDSIYSPSATDSSSTPEFLFGETEMLTDAEFHSDDESDVEAEARKKFEANFDVNLLCFDQEPLEQHKHMGTVIQEDALNELLGAEDVMELLFGDVVDLS